MLQADKHVLGGHGSSSQADDATAHNRAATNTLHGVNKQAAQEHCSPGHEAAGIMLAAPDTRTSLPLESPQDRAAAWRAWFETGATSSKLAAQSTAPEQDAAQLLTEAIIQQLPAGSSTTAGSLSQLPLAPPDPEGTATESPVAMHASQPPAPSEAANSPDHLLDQDVRVTTAVPAQSDLITGVPPSRSSIAEVAGTQSAAEKDAAACGLDSASASAKADDAVAVSVPTVNAVAALDNTAAGSVPASVAVSSFEASKFDIEAPGAKSDKRAGTTGSPCSAANGLLLGVPPAAEVQEASTKQDLISFEDQVPEQQAASCLALPCLALPCLAWPCLALPCLVWQHIKLSLHVAKVASSGLWWSRLAAAAV
jgi:hypothetical protein